MIDTELWINMALVAIGCLEDGTDFTLKELFEEAEWKKLDIGDRLHLGREFKRKAKKGDFPHVNYVEASKNPARYVYKK